MLSRSLLAGVQSRSCPSSWVRVRLGLAGPDSSYFQPVAILGLASHPSLVWGPSGAPQSLKYLDDVVAWAERPDPEITADGEVVFVGYGIRAPEWRWDDYKDTGVRGKVVLMLVNDPALQDSTVFNGRALTYYGRWTYKLEEAARRAALGALLIHTTESATYPGDVVRGSWTEEQFKHDRDARCCSSRRRLKRVGCSGARRTSRARWYRSGARPPCSTSTSPTYAAPPGTSMRSGSTVPRSGQCSRLPRSSNRSPLFTNPTSAGRSTARIISRLRGPACPRCRSIRDETSWDGPPDGGMSRTSSTTARAITSRAMSTAQRSATQG